MSVNRSNTPENSSWHTTGSVCEPDFVAPASAHELRRVHASGPPPTRRSSAGSCRCAPRPACRSPARAPRTRRPRASGRASPFGIRGDHHARGGRGRWRASSRRRCRRRRWSAGSPGRSGGRRTPRRTRRASRCTRARTPPGARARSRRSWRRAASRSGTAPGGRCRRCPCRRAGPWCRSCRAASSRSCTPTGAKSRNDRPGGGGEADRAHALAVVERPEVALVAVHDLRRAVLELRRHPSRPRCRAAR